MPPEPSDIYAQYIWASDLLACAEEALEDNSTSTPKVPERACVYNGGVDVAFDDDCGQLWVAWGRTYPTMPFPQPVDVGNIAKCWSQGAMLAVEYEVGIVRCAPTMESTGASPTCEAIDASAQQMFEDAAIIRRAVACCLAEWDNDKTGNRGLWLEQVPAGDEGGLVGSVLRVVVGMPNCVCLPEPGS